VVKLFAASSVALSDWSVDWGANDRTMNNAVTPQAAMLETTPAEPPSLSPPVPAEPESAAPTNTEETEGEQPTTVDDEGAMLRWARHSIQFWKLIVATVAAGYQAGFLWVAAVGVYLLMRRDIDGVQLTEVYVDPADEYGLPPLADEATSGVPEVMPHAPATPGNLGP